jgi:hypothetical protein
MRSRPKATTREAARMMSGMTTGICRIISRTLLVRLPQGKRSMAMARMVPRIVAMTVETNASRRVFQAASRIHSFSNSLVYHCRVNPFQTSPRRAALTEKRPRRSGEVKKSHGQVTTMAMVIKVVASHITSISFALAPVNVQPDHGQHHQSHADRPPRKASPGWPRIAAGSDCPPAYIWPRPADRAPRTCPWPGTKVKMMPTDKPGMVWGKMAWRKTRTGEA